MAQRVARTKPNSPQSQPSSEENTKEQAFSTPELIFWGILLFSSGAANVVGDIGVETIVLYGGAGIYAAIVTISYNIRLVFKQGYQFKISDAVGVVLSILGLPVTAYRFYKLVRKTKESIDTVQSVKNRAQQITQRARAASLRQGKLAQQRAIVQEKSTQQEGNIKSAAGIAAGRQPVTVTNEEVPQEDQNPSEDQSLRGLLGEEEAFSPLLTQEQYPEILASDADFSQRTTTPNTLDNNQELTTQSQSGGVAAHGTPLNDHSEELLPSEESFTEDQYDAIISSPDSGIIPSQTTPSTIGKSVQKKPSSPSIARPAEYRKLSPEEGIGGEIVGRGGTTQFPDVPDGVSVRKSQSGNYFYYKGGEPTFLSPVQKTAGDISGPVTYKTITRVASRNEQGLTDANGVASVGPVSITHSPPRIPRGPSYEELIQQEPEFPTPPSFDQLQTSTKTEERVSAPDREQTLDIQKKKEEVAIPSEYPDYSQLVNLDESIPYIEGFGITPSIPQPNQTKSSKKSKPSVFPDISNREERSTESDIYKEIMQGVDLAPFDRDILDGRFGFSVPKNLKEPPISETLPASDDLRESITVENQKKTQEKIKKNKIEAKANETEQSVTETIHQQITQREADKQEVLKQKHTLAEQAGSARLKELEKESGLVDLNLDTMLPSTEETLNSEVLPNIIDLSPSQSQRHTSQPSKPALHPDIKPSDSSSREIDSDIDAAYEKLISRNNAVDLSDKSPQNKRNRE